MANKQVTITVLNAAGDMAYSASVLHVAPGDSIKWSSGANTGAFSLTFTGTSSPLDEGSPLQSGAGNTVTGTVKSSGASGVYYYSVSATYTPTGGTATDPGCPEIVVG